MLDKRRPAFLIMIVAGAILVILAGLALVHQGQSPEVINTPTPATVEVTQRVSLQDAKAAFDAGTAVFVDVRDSGSYSDAHIPGARLIPLNELSDHLAELDPSSWIITYCT